MKQKLAVMGISEEDFTYQTAVMVGVINQAMKGNTKALHSYVTLLEKTRHMNSGKESSIRRLQNLNTIDSRRKHRGKKTRVHLHWLMQ